MRVIQKNNEVFMIGTKLQLLDVLVLFRRVRSSDANLSVMFRDLSVLLNPITDEPNTAKVLMYRGEIKNSNSLFDTLMVALSSLVKVWKLESNKDDDVNIYGIHSFITEEHEKPMLLSNK